MLDFQRDIAPYLLKHGETKPDKKLLHKFYQESIDHAKLVESVFGDAYPEFLQVDRPKEKDKPSHRKFREAIYKAVTKPFRRRLIRTLSAIRNADDFTIEFPQVESTIPFNETLNFYTTENFGAWKSLEQWFWEQGIQHFIDDPNACAVLLPKIPENPTDYREVVPIWAMSDQVWYYAEGEKAVICAQAKSDILVNSKKVKEGLILYFFDRESYCIAEQKSANGGRTTWEILGIEVVQDESGKIDYNQAFPLHHFRTMPVFKLGSQIRKTSEDGVLKLFESYVADAIPALKSVLQRSSDIDIEALLHTGSLEWQYVTKKCGVCSGEGKIKSFTTTRSGKDKATTTKCTKCGGNGWDIYDSHLEKILISTPAAEGFDDTKPVNLPTPPAGMIERSPNAIKEFREEYRRNMIEAYQTVGLGHIADQIFMNTSGTSKHYDRDEGEKMTMDTSKHFVSNLLQPMYAATDAIRYGPIGKAGEQVPIIVSPKRFDISSIDMTREELNDAMTNNYSEELKDMLQLRYLNQMGGKDSTEYKTFRVKMQLDPHRNKTDETKSFLLSQAYLTMDRESEEFSHTVEQLQFSINFETALRDVVLKQDKFFQLPIEKQYELLIQANKAYFSVRPAGQPIEMSTLAPLVNAKDVNQMQE
ncbi:hypothetical protein GCM10007423_39850 [Dyadobacter endophyticus]|uniref:Phage portal protein n=1 Tax=Dyadobacter endophyticus TaxID=1749036 RepID=A0ABQ1YZV0_9BACT|nr:hypothetical protein [Dyadobacter endophyticus]GGH42876.1 hypothetical protein GCM10007423_39850 [Dyadobacter endophyticus]